MAIKAKIEIKNLKRILEAANAASDEVLFKFGKEGVEFRQMDSAQISMVAAMVPKSQFTEYSVGDQAVLTEGAPAPADYEMVFVNVAKLVSAVGNLGDVIEMEIAKGGNRMNFASSGLGIKKRFSIPLIDAGKNDLGKLPKIEPVVTVVMDTADFKKTFRELGAMTDAAHVSFSVADGVFAIESVGDSNSADVKFDKTSKSVKSMDGELVKLTKSAFPMKSLNTLLGAIKSSSIRLQLCTNKPIIIKDTEWDISALLAPRIDTD